MDILLSICRHVTKASLLWNLITAMPTLLRLFELYPATILNDFIQWNLPLGAQQPAIRVLLGNMALAHGSHLNIQTLFTIRNRNIESPLKALRCLASVDALKDACLEQHLVWFSAVVCEQRGNQLRKVNGTTMQAPGLSDVSSRFSTTEEHRVLRPLWRLMLFCERLRRLHCVKSFKNQRRIEIHEYIRSLPEWEADEIRSVNECLNFVHGFSTVYVPSYDAWDSYYLLGELHPEPDYAERFESALSNCKRLTASQQPATLPSTGLLFWLIRSLSSLPRPELGSFTSSGWLLIGATIWDRRRLVQHGIFAEDGPCAYFKDCPEEGFYKDSEIDALQSFLRSPIPNQMKVKALFIEERLDHLVREVDEIPETFLSCLL